jgi:hypothetical protein
MKPGVRTAAIGLTSLALASAALLLDGSVSRPARREPIVYFQLYCRDPQQPVVPSCLTQVPVPIFGRDPPV